MNRDLLRDDQWERLCELLPGKPTDPGRTAANNRVFLEAVLWVLRCGAPWRDLPPALGHWNSTYRRFARWAINDVWNRIFKELSKDSDFEETFLDSTVIRAHQHAAGAPKNKGDQALGRSRGGLTSKIHAMVESLGNLAGWQTTAGQVHDCMQAEALLDEIPPAEEGEAPRSTAADKAYDTNAIVQKIEASGATPVIPPRANRIEPRKFDRDLYKNRNLIERFFCRIKQFRRIATRYDKLVERFDAFIALAAAFIWLA